MNKVIRVAVFTIVSLILLNSLIFIAIAVYKSVQGYILIVQGKMEDKPGILLAESLDSFMVALFFIIFSIGISKLFLPKFNFLGSYELSWLKIENFSQLKYLLWEVLLTTLFVYFGAQVVIARDHLDWVMLVTPGSILMLTLAYKFLKGAH